MVEFLVLRERLAEKAASVGQFDKLIKLELDGNIVVLNGKTSPPSVMDDTDSPDITITSSVAIFSDLLDKKINPQLAIITRKIKIKGDILAATPLMDML